MHVVFLILIFICYHSKTAPEYLEQAEKILSMEKPDSNTNSFIIFLNLLARVVERFQQTDAKNQIMKIKGKSSCHCLLVSSFYLFNSYF